MQKVKRALERVQKADKAAGDARLELRRVMQQEIDAGRLTKAAIARGLGITRQRVQQIISGRSR
jgi:predicted XRE-type DNA-binding protein